MNKETSGTTLVKRSIDHLLSLSLSTVISQWGLTAQVTLIKIPPITLGYVVCLLDAPTKLALEVLISILTSTYKHPFLVFELYRDLEFQITLRFGYCILRRFLIYNVSLPPSIPCDGLMGLEFLSVGVYIAF
uniref:Uncharacterized protein n=1 Tax=Chenopodium quinoa TaxID=63459 RepID=A0A803M6B6_CHEQI